MNNRKIRVAITHGDTNGIGYELIFKTFSSPEMLELCTPIIYGSPMVAAYHRKALGIQANFSIVNNTDEIKDGRLNLLTCFEDEVKVELGTPTEESGRAAIRALDRAMTDYREGVYDVLVCAPIGTNNLKVGGLEFKNLAHYLQTCLGEGHEAMPVFMNDFLRVALVSNQLLMKDAMEDIKEQNLINRATVLCETMRRDMRVSSPRIAVLALNPTADGVEEKEVIAPAITKLIEAGVYAYGPYPAEEFFGSNQYEAFDAILSMHYEQAILPFKTLTIDEGVCLIANLPLVCTTTNDSPEFAKAGAGVMDEQPMRQAVYLAIDAWRNRMSFEEPLKNPLPKLYHERRENRDRGRLNGVKRNDKDNQKLQEAE